MGATGGSFALVAHSVASKGTSGAVVDDEIRSTGSREGGCKSELEEEEEEGGDSDEGLHFDLSMGLLIDRMN